MGHARRRPIVGRTADGVGATYIVVDGQDDTHVQCIANGTATYTVDYTLQNILFDSAATAAVQGNAEQDRYVAAASADWISLIASQVNVNSNASLSTPVFAIRIDITAGTGSVSFHIKQD